MTRLNEEYHVFCFVFLMTHRVVSLSPTSDSWWYWIIVDITMCVNMINDVWWQIRKVTHTIFYQNENYFIYFSCLFFPARLHHKNLSQKHFWICLKTCWFCMTNLLHDKIGEINFALLINVERMSLFIYHRKYFLRNVLFHSFHVVHIISCVLLSSYMFIGRCANWLTTEVRIGNMCTNLYVL